ncbi:hypothetical protein DICVIV_04203 [Dictyocaulus viviparus]|uniref:Uncharacterized protein n=1 Tax=Dictyocaulus viviparus TaxID=29172 RepID=A0A0D8Y0I3_DICVI|nr:hypothetical protein DICVIV_04203 [Dictyocaulus viviparus]
MRFHADSIHLFIAASLGPIARFVHNGYNPVHLGSSSSPKKERFHLFEFGKDSESKVTSMFIGSSIDSCIAVDDDAEQLTNVFSLLGSMAPSRAPEICFSEDFTAIKSTEELSYTRIKLLTPEEVARDEF